MALHLPFWSLKTRFGLEPGRDANPVPTTPLADDLGTAPSGPDKCMEYTRKIIKFRLVFLCLFVQ